MISREASGASKQPRQVPDGFLLGHSCCPLCGRQSAEPIGCTVWGTPDPVDDIVVHLAYCRDCDFGYAAPMPSDRDVELYFSGTAAYNEPEKMQDHERLRWYTGRQVLRLLQKVAPPPARLLDVGSAHGHFLYWAREAGYSVSGFEISDSASACAAELLGPGVIRYAADLGSAGYSPCAFDVITMLDVLYYSREPLSLLRKAFDLLRSGGHLLIRLTNRLWARRLLWRLNPRLTFGSDGILWFSTRSIQRALSLGGFVLEGLMPVYGTSDNHGGLAMDILVKTVAYCCQLISMGSLNLHPSLLVVARRGPDGVRGDLCQHRGGS